MQKLYDEYMVAKENIKKELYSGFLQFIKEKNLSFLVDDFTFCEIEDNLLMNLSTYSKL